MTRVLLFISIVTIVAFYAWIFLNIRKHKPFRDQVVIEGIKVFFIIVAGVLVAYLANLYLPEIILRNQIQFEINKSTLEKQDALVQRTLALMYAPYYNMLRVTNSINRDDIGGLQTSWSDYQTSMTNWNLERENIVSQLAVQLGFPIAQEIQTDQEHSSLQNPVAIQDQLVNADYDLRQLKICYDNECPTINLLQQRASESSKNLYEHIDRFRGLLTQTLINKGEFLKENPYEASSATTTL